MQKYLDKPIKEIIRDFPKTRTILENYNIGCVPCTAGNCMLKDIVSIHNLSESDEAELLWKIEKELYPDRKIGKPMIFARKKVAGTVTYSPPIKKLVDEHVLIKKLLNIIPQFCANIDSTPSIDNDSILNCIDFIRSYADKYHHAKEEEILFEYFDNNTDIIKTMLEDHKKGREYVKGVLGAVEHNNKSEIIKNLESYANLLTEHIKKEDEILYPWMDRNLSISQIGELFSRFDEADKKLKSYQEKYEKIIQKLSEKI